MSVQPPNFEIAPWHGRHHPCSCQCADLRAKPIYQQRYLQFSAYGFPAFNGSGKRYKVQTEQTDWVWDIPYATDGSITFSAKRTVRLEDGKESESDVSGFYTQGYDFNYNGTHRYQESGSPNNPPYSSTPPAISFAGRYWNVTTTEDGSPVNYRDNFLLGVAFDTYGDVHDTPVITETTKKLVSRQGTSITRTTVYTLSEEISSDGYQAVLDAMREGCPWSKLPDLPAFKFWPENESYLHPRFGAGAISVGWIGPNTNFSTPTQRRDSYLALKTAEQNDRTNNTAWRDTAPLSTYKTNFYNYLIALNDKWIGIYSDMAAQAFAFTFDSEPQLWFAKVSNSGPGTRADADLRYRWLSTFYPTYNQSEPAYREGDGDYEFTWWEIVATPPSEDGQNTEITRTGKNETVSPGVGDTFAVCAVTEFAGIPFSLTDTKRGSLGGPVVIDVGVIVEKHQASADKKGYTSYLLDSGQPPKFFKRETASGTDADGRDFTGSHYWENVDPGNNEQGDENESGWVERYEFSDSVSEILFSEDFRFLIPLSVTETVSTYSNGLTLTLSEEYTDADLTSQASADLANSNATNSKSSYSGDNRGNSSNDQRPIQERAASHFYTPDHAAIFREHCRYKIYAWAPNSISNYGRDGSKPAWSVKLTLENIDLDSGEVLEPTEVSASLNYQSDYQADYAAYGKWSESDYRTVDEPSTNRCIQFGKIELTGPTPPLLVGTDCLFKVVEEAG